MTDGEFREAVRADIARAYGPEVIHDALYSEEARSYIAAREQADADMAAFAERVKRNADEFAARISSMWLPEGMRFAWEPVNVIANAEERAGIALAVMSDEEAEAFAVAWRAAFDGAPRHKRVVLLTPLPRRVRLRLACQSAFNRLGCWLVSRGCLRAARTLWRIK